MDEVIKHAYKGELDLFVARTQLDLIARFDGGFEAAKKVKRHFIKSAEQQTPLLNYTDMLQDVLNVGDFALFKQIKETYDPVLKRDPTFIEVRLARKIYVWEV